MRRVTETGEWVESIDATTVVMGITRQAADEIGNPTFIELPQVDEEFEEGDLICVVESTKAAIDISTPVSGRVISVNERLEKEPSLLFKDPEKEGWICKLSLS